MRVAASKRQQEQVQRVVKRADAAMTFVHSGSRAVYAPNSYGGPVAAPGRAGEVSWEVESGELGRYAYEKHADDDDFGQASSLYRDVMNDVDRVHLVANIVAHAGDNVSENVQLRVIAYFASIDPGLGSCVANGLGRDTTSPAYAEALKLVESRANRA